jgi:cysteinyl-tRNA synthetase
VRTIRLYDTLRREVRPLEPRDEGAVGIYACGPTVYSRVHVGNARPFVVFSQLKRFLEHEGYRVTLVANITDINDKIYDAAQAAGRESADLAREMTAYYMTDTGRLGPGRPDHEPLASGYVEPIIDLIGALVERGHAYAVDGDVYFRVRTLPEYGALSKRDVEQMDQGEGVEGADRKEDPLDFALWKAHKEGEDTRWDSPWGRGRPGWHIECSAMAESLLGLEFDIHGGGIDLVFPHHENEIAQTCCAFRVPRMANVWMHNGFLQMEGEKMSKSLGNFTTIRDLLKDWPGEVLRYTMLRTHYRQPIDWTLRSLEESERTLDRWYGLEADAAPRFGEAVLDALADDLNTPKMIAELHALDGRGASGELVANLRALGFLLEGRAAWTARRQAALGVDPARVDALIASRKAARAARDFAESDRIRDELAGLGVVVKDNRDGTTSWELAR